MMAISFRFEVFETFFWNESWNKDKFKVFDESFQTLNIMLRNDYAIKICPLNKVLSDSMRAD